MPGLVPGIHVLDMGGREVGYDRDISLSAGPLRLESAAGDLPETLDKAAVMLKLVGDDQLAVLEVGNRRVIRRTTMQSVRYFLLKSLVPIFQVSNG
jgi:hypothetical protein